MSEETLFISDCHLDASQPRVVNELIEFLDRRAGSAAKLYILGDLFEVWIGDDDPARELNPVFDALRRLARSTQLYFLGGNRDFLVGKKFAERCGISLIEEPEILQLGTSRTVLIHGDTLCTDDHDYQAFRKLVRSSEWRTEFLGKSLTERQQIAAGLRSDSAKAMADKAEEIMDVNDDAVSRCFSEYQVEVIIHGHTHRPAVHRYADGSTRYVLGDWAPQPSFLSWQSDNGFTLIDPRI